MRVVIFGCGAMACLFGARLSRVARVTLIGTWRDGIRAIQKRGVWIEDSRESQSFRVEADFPGSQPASADLGLVLVKSWQTREVAGYLHRYLNREGVAVSLQNGLGNVELLGERASPGTTSEGATLLGPGHIRTGGSGTTNAVAPAHVVELFKNAGFETYGCSPGEADSLVWGKLAVSCGINALTAVLRISNGELLNRPPAADLMGRAAAECAAVAGARGIFLPFSDAAARAREVAARTAGNRSSMLQDILRGAPTECDAINGAVVSEGRRLGIPTPVNEVLCRLVRAAAHSNNGSDR